MINDPIRGFVRPLYLRADTGKKQGVFRSQISKAPGTNADHTKVVPRCERKAVGENELNMASSGSGRIRYVLCASGLSAWRTSPFRRRTSIFGPERGSCPSEIRHGL